MNIDLNSLTREQILLLQDFMHETEISQFLADKVSEFLGNLFSEHSRNFVARWESVICADKNSSLPYIKSKLECGEIHTAFITTAVNSVDYKNRKTRDIEALDKANGIIDLENTLDNLSETAQQDTDIQAAFNERKNEIEKQRIAKAAAELEANRKAAAELEANRKAAAWAKEKAEMEKD